MELKVGIVGSRRLDFEIDESYLPMNTTLIISGGARGIDRKARELALRKKIPILEIVPDYALYGKQAPIKRNDIIISKSDIIIAFWDGKSSGTRYVINQCKKQNKKIKVHIINA